MRSPLPLLARQHEHPDTPVRSHRKFQVAILLCGVVLCLDILQEPFPVTGYGAVNPSAERILLLSQDGIQVDQDIVLNHQAMFSNGEFERLTGNSHIWAHIQTVEVRGHWGTITYFKFRSVEDARSVHERMQAAEVSPREAELQIATRTFLLGYYVAVVRTSSDEEGGKVFFLRVYNALCIRYEEAKCFGL